jgi:hypothetical protein
MLEPDTSLRSQVANWITDVQRRGALLYALNEGDGTHYLSFEGRERITYSLEVDYTVQEITVQIVDPKASRPENETLALDASNLGSLSRRMCPVKEGMAIIPNYLIAQMTIVCHAYKRLIADYDRTVGITTTTESITEIENELKQFLTPEEQRRTDNPLLLAREQVKAGPGK